MKVKIKRTDVVCVYTTRQDVDGFSVHRNWVKLKMPSGKDAFSSGEFNSDKTLTVFIRNKSGNYIRTRHLFMGEPELEAKIKDAVMAAYENQKKEVLRCLKN